VRRGHAAFLTPPVGELGDTRPHDDEPRRDDLECLLPVAADDLSFAVLR
jgi:hypothetical protein